MMELLDSPAFDFEDHALTRLIEKAKLDKNLLKSHYLRFLSFQRKAFQNQSFTIKDSCRLDNGRILPYTVLENFPLCVKKVGSFIPAAGSSTRYIQPIYEVHKSANLNCKNWLLPRHHDHSLLSIEDMLELPKALYPCVEEGHTFFELKLLEQMSVSRIDRSIFVIPEGSLEKFYSLMESKQLSKDQIFFLEQGVSLCTLRFDKEGRVLASPHSLDTAPAGHGSLIHVFPSLKKRFPDLDSLFIRNIDNIVGSHEKNLQITEHFLNAHAFTLDVLKNIRSALEREDVSQAGLEALQISSRFPLRKLSEEEQFFLNHEVPRNETLLWMLQLGLFQSPLGLCRKQNLLELYQRPLNMLGQVANTGKDQGGIPVLVDSEDGELAICLELPHFSPEDRLRMEDRNFATHFNPVFAAIELQSSIQNYDPEHHPHWIFAEKRWKDQTVYYHESLLYELIGNSKSCNLIFVELDRNLFNPHKTLDDSSGKRLSMWI